MSAFEKAGIDVPIHVNLADFFIDEVQTFAERTKQLDRFQLADDDSGTGSQQQQTKPAHTVASFPAQLLAISHRELISQARHPLKLFSNVTMYLVISIICMLTWWQMGYNVDEQDPFNRQGCIFFIIVNAVFMPPFAVAATYPSERSLFLRERASGFYSTFAYFLGTTLTSLPFSAFYTLFFAAAYGAAGLNPDADRFFTFVLTIFIVIDFRFKLRFAIYGL